MRTLVTFVMRLWIDPQVEKLAWEGRVENVTNGQRAHVRSLEELARFIDAQMGNPDQTEGEQAGPGNLSA